MRATAHGEARRATRPAGGLARGRPDAPGYLFELLLFVVLLLPLLLPFLAPFFFAGIVSALRKALLVVRQCARNH